MPLRKGTAVVLRSRGRGGKERDSAFKEPKHGQNIKVSVELFCIFVPSSWKMIWRWTLLPDFGQVCLRDLPKEDMVYLRDPQKEVHVCLRDPQKESHVSDPQKKAMSSSESLWQRPTEGRRPQRLRLWGQGWVATGGELSLQITVQHDQCNLLQHRGTF